MFAQHSSFESTSNSIISFETIIHVLILWSQSHLYIYTLSIQKLEPSTRVNSIKVLVSVSTYPYGTTQTIYTQSEQTQKSYTSSSIDKKCRTKPAAKLTQKSAASITHICEIVILHTLRVRLIVWPTITTILRHPYHHQQHCGVLYTANPQSVVNKSGLRARR